MAGITLTGNWEIPDANTTGTIQNTDTGYLSANAGSAVVEGALENMDDEQEWERSADDNSGYFTLMNPNSGKFLTGHKSPNMLTIEGSGLFFFM